MNVESEEASFTDGGTEPNEQVHSETICTPKTTTEQKQGMEVKRRTRESLPSNIYADPKITERQHFKKNQQVRIVCDANKKGLKADLQQQKHQGWMATHFASRFLIISEQKISVHGPEPVAVVWNIETFGKFVYGTQFEVLSDHKKLTSVLKENVQNKKYPTRLSRTVDPLLLFEFTVTPGRTLGIADYVTRHPSPSNNINQMKAEELCNIWFTVHERKCEKIVLGERKKRRTENQPITAELTVKSKRTVSRGVAGKNAMSKPEKLTIKSIIASICEPLRWKAIQIARLHN